MIRIKIRNSGCKVERAIRSVLGSSNSQDAIHMSQAIHNEKANKQEMSTDHNEARLKTIWLGSRTAELLNYLNLTL